MLPGVSSWTPPNSKHPPPKLGEPPLHRAARQGHDEEVRQLVHGGVRVDDLFEIQLDPGARPEPASALMVAAGSGDGATVATVQLLLDLGAEVELAPIGMTALWYASGGLSWNYRPGGDAPRLAALLDAGADASFTRPARSGGAGVSPLARAAAAGDPDRVRLLIDAGADPDPEGALPPFEVPLDAAIESGSVESVRLLLAAGAVIDSHRDAHADPAIGSASSLEMVRVLLDSGADPNAPCGYGKSVAEMVARNGQATVEERVAMLRALVDAGVDLDARTPRAAPLFGAAMNGDADAVEALLRAGADPHVEPKAMSAACFSCFERRHDGMERTIGLLIDSGVDPDDSDERGFRPLHAALAPDTYGPGYEESDGFNLAASIALLDRGASIDITYPDTGSGPLHAAAAAGSDELVEELLRRGADPTAVSTEGEVPIDVARRFLDMLRSQPPSLDRAREVHKKEESAHRLYAQWVRTREAEIARTERCITLLTRILQPGSWNSVD
jgi:cytohesin